MSRIMFLNFYKSQNVSCLRVVRARQKRPATGAVVGATGQLTCSGDVEMKTGGPRKISRNTGMSFWRNFVYSRGTVWVKRSIESRSSLAIWSLSFTSATVQH